MWLLVLMRTLPVEAGNSAFEEVCLVDEVFCESICWWMEWDLWSFFGGSGGCYPHGAVGLLVVMYGCMSSWVLFGMLFSWADFRFSYVSGVVFWAERVLLIMEADEVVVLEAVDGIRV